MKTCPVDGCRKELTNSYKLKLHLERFHLNIKNFQCQHCLKAFKSRDSLNRHGFKHREASLPVNFALEGRRRVPVAPSKTPVPLLTHMVKYAEDPELRPYVHIQKEYPFAYDNSMPILAKIATAKPSW